MPTPHDEHIKELTKIRKATQSIDVQLKEEINKPFKKKILAAFGMGIARGLGFVIGTTIVVALAVIILQAIVDWTSIENDFINWLSQMLIQAQPR